MFIAFACTVVNDLVRFYLVRVGMSVRMKPENCSEFSLSVIDNRAESTVYK